MKSLIELFLLTILVSICAVPSAFSQASSSTAELRGQVTDSAGAAVPNATVTVTDTSKGTKQTTTTNSEGVYTFLNLLPSVTSVPRAYSAVKRAARFCVAAG